MLFYKLFIYRLLWIHSKSDIALLSLIMKFIFTFVTSITHHANYLNSEDWIFLINNIQFVPQCALLQKSECHPDISNESD